MALSNIIIGVLCGILLAEALGYIWHRFVCHLGLLRWVGNDILRQRHHDHHMRKYNLRHLRTPVYEESCEIAFYPIGVLAIVVLITLPLLNILSWHVSLSVLTGALLFSIHGLGGIHTLYHLDDEVVRRKWVFRFEWVWKCFKWLRDFHDIHHLVADKNHSIMMAWLDWIGGSYCSPKKLPQLLGEGHPLYGLFPGFNARLSSSCRTPLKWK